MAKSFYIIGGESKIKQTESAREIKFSLSTIARFDTKTLTWSFAGQLNTERHAHGVIQQGLKFLVVGGQLLG